MSTSARVFAMRPFNSALVSAAFLIISTLLAVYYLLNWIDADRDFVDSRDPPLITEIFTADPSAHVFNDTIYIYPSHDIDYDDEPYDDAGGAFKMRDYHVLSLPNGPSHPAQDLGCCALKLEDVDWAERQFWAPDAAQRDNFFYLYFPAKQQNGIFGIGVAVSDRPEGPFTPNEHPIKGAYSIDPAVFEDDSGEYYLYFGGIEGGQLQQWSFQNEYLGKDSYPRHSEAQIPPRIARLSSNMQELAEDARPLLIVDEHGKALKAGNQKKRFFEASWVHKHKGTYYLSYSTGDTHLIVYATSSSPYGPFQYRGILLKPVVGWTTHHSVVEYHGQWYLFYHDSELSGGVTHLRNIKMAPLEHNPDGSIQTIDPYY